MKKSVFVMVVVFALVAGAPAQTPKYKYEITKFGAPFPNATGQPRDTVSVAADGKGSGFTMDDNDTFYVGDTNGHQLITVKDGKVIDRIGGLQVEAHQATRDSGTGALYLADTGAPGGMIWKVVIKK